MNEEPRVMVIEGQRVLAIQRTPPLPPTLDRLLATMRVTHRAPLVIRGTRAVCQSEQDHRLVLFCEGRHVGRDGIVRDLRLFACQDCGAVGVRDTSFDRLPGLTTGRRGPARKDAVLGWYSGARPSQREYR